MKFAPGAWRYAIVPLLAAPFAFIYSVKASLVAVALGVGTLAFFRDPDRTPPPTGVVAPADGTVSVIRTEDDRLRLGTFMNVHNVHVVRAPFESTVVAVEHTPGGYKPAFSKESDRNEKVHLRLEPTHGPTTDDAHSKTTAGDDHNTTTATVTFIAGAFARRIHPYVEPGDELERGQRIGHIAFGSRVDVLFPPAIDRSALAVEHGEKLTAGESVLLESDRDGGLGGVAFGTGFDVRETETETDSTDGTGETDGTAEHDENGDTETSQ